MMFALVPAGRRPTVTTAKSAAATSRDTTVWSRITIAAAITTGSTVVSGMDPWPPRPWSVIRTVSVAAYAGPACSPTKPAGSGVTCWPRTTSGLGKRVPQAVVDHRLGAHAQLLGRLEDRHQGARPGVARPPRAPRRRPGGR